MSMIPGGGSWLLPNLREWRMSRMLTQTELGRRVGLSHSAISMIERGGGASRSTIEKLAREMRISVDSLIYRTPRRSPPRRTTAA